MKKVLLIVAGSFTFFVHSQNAQIKKDSLEVSDLYMDFAPPNVAASSLLNIEPTSITKPGSVKEFFVGLGSFVDLQGNVKPNLSLEWAPLKTFSKKCSSWDSKCNGFNLKSFAFSLASVSDSSNARIAGAFKWTLIDRTNPLLVGMGRDKIEKLSEELQFLSYIQREKNQVLINDLNIALNNLNFPKVADRVLFENAIDVKNSAYGKILATTLDASGKDSTTKYEMVIEQLRDSVDNAFPLGIPGVTSKQLEELYEKSAAVFWVKNNLRQMMKTDFEKDLKAFKAEFKRENWNKWTFEIGFGGILNSVDATIQEMRHHYQTVYVSTAFCPFGTANWDKGFGLYLKKHSQVIALVKYTNYTTQDSINNNECFAGTRFLIGDYNKRFSAEVALINIRNQVTGLNQSGARYSIGAEFRLSDGNWLEFAFGGESFNGTNRVNLLPRLAFRHAFNSENRFFK